MLMFPSLFKANKKLRKRQTLESNKYKGRMAEESVRMRYAMQGYDVERTGHGSDYKVTKRDLFTGRRRASKLVEVKSGNAKESKLQKKTHRKHKGRYKVERTSGWF